MKWITTRKQWCLLILLNFLIMSITTSSMALTEGQQKLLAKRAAQVDGYRKLAELVKGLQIQSNTYVRDFVAESDQIQTSFDHFIKGAKVSGLPRYYEDGTCELDMEMTLMQVVQALKTIAVEHRHPFGSHTHVWDEMIQFNQKKVIRVTGSGVPRPEPTFGEPLEAQAPVYSSPTGGMPGWENVTAQGRLMAQRAAKVDAYRNLAEVVKGLQISSNTYVRDFVAESDEISTRLDTFLKSVKQIGPYRYMPDGIVECDVEVAIQTIVKELVAIRDWHVHRHPNYQWRHVHLRTVRFEEITKIYPKKFVRATGNGTVPAKYMRSSSPAEKHPMVASKPVWASQMLSALGTGIPTEGVSSEEGKIMAMRAAEMDAKRNLAEMVYGVQINSQTTVRDYVTENDQIQAKVQTVLAGARVSNPVFLEDGSVEIVAEISMEEVWDQLETYLS